MPASPSTNVDTVTGEGLAGYGSADVVVDVSNAPVWEDDAVREFFVTSTRNLLAAERDAGVRHHLAVSIVGCDRLPESGYLRAKVAQEAGSRPAASRTRSSGARSSSSSSVGSSSPAPTASACGSRSGCCSPSRPMTLRRRWRSLAIGHPVGGRVELAGPEALW